MEFCKFWQLVKSPPQIFIYVALWMHKYHDLLFLENTLTGKYNDDVKLMFSLT